MPSKARGWVTASPCSAPPALPSPALQVYDFLHYWPSLALAIVALVLFTSVAAVTAWMTERRRMYRFVHLVT